jgi:hypothetical protein
VRGVDGTCHEGESTVDTDEEWPVGAS